MGEAGHYRLEGAVNFGAPPTRDLLSPGIVPVAGSATIDLDGLEQADSVALALLLDWQRQARAQGFRLVLNGVSDRLAALIRVTGLGSLFAPGS